MKKLTKEEALNAIPEGWVRCDYYTHCHSSAIMRFMIIDGGEIYAIPNPREPIRKMTTMAFRADGCVDNVPATYYVRDCLGLTAYEAAGRKFAVTVEEVME